MKKLMLAAAMATFAASAAPADAALVSIDVYDTATQGGDGSPFSGYVGTLGSDTIAFLTNSPWTPFGLSSYGAVLTGTLDVATAGTYDFTLRSDDGSRLFIDGALAVDNGGVHSPNTVTSSATLSAGLHPFQINFFQCCGFPAGVDLLLPTGVTLVPLPSAALLLLTGVLGLGWASRRRG